MAELKNVTIFPSTKAKSINKLITENSLTRLINRLIDVDGYVITNELESILGEDITTDIPITQYVLNDVPFEFSIHGYYFAVDSLKDIIDQLAWNPSDNVIHAVYARIFIDTGVEGYPELCGQYTQTPIVQTVDAFTSGTTTLTDFTDLDHIEANDVTLWDDSSEISAVGSVSVDSNGVVSCTSFIDGKSASDVKSIHYTKLDYYAGLQILEVVSENDTDIPTLSEPTIITNGDIYDAHKYDYYDLMLLKYYKPSNSSTWGRYVPVESLYKFKSHSITTIDGGEIAGV